MKYRRIAYIKCMLRLQHFLILPVAPKFHMSSGFPVSSLVIVSALALTCWVLLRQKRRQYKYPPGPSPKPIIGNALDIRTEKPWLTYMKWSKEFNSAFPHGFTDVTLLHATPVGDILGLTAMNMNMIVLHKFKDAEMLLEKRSSIYSDRPVLPVIEL